MRMGGRLGVVTVVALWAMGATAEESWRTVVDGPISIKTREVPNSDVHEYLVEGVVDASTEDLQATLCDPGRFPRFMPHVTEAKVLEHLGSVDRVYTRIDPPIGGARDYITEVKVVQTVHEDGTGRFVQVWRALPDAIPTREGVTRIRINEGSWEITPREDGRSQVVYRFRVDPGGWVPDFIADLANKKAIPATVHAIEREAQRRGRARSRTAEASGQKPTKPEREPF